MPAQLHSSPKEFGVHVAINGDFFGPVRDDGVDTASGVNAHGLTVANGEVVSEGFAAPGTNRNALYHSR